MKGYLLDTNLLIALLWPSHEKHDLALKWFTRHRAKGWATCPITQAGFVRIVSNPSFSRDAVRPRDAVQVLPPTLPARTTPSGRTNFRSTKPSPSPASGCWGINK